MPVGDFPTVFPTIMKCWLNRMVTSENGITHKRYGIFQYSVIFDWSCTFFTDHEQYFLGKYLHIHAYSTYLNLEFTIRCCMFSANVYIVYCSWKDLFAIYMHMLHICSTRKTRDGRKCVNNFGVLGVSGLNK